MPSPITIAKMSDRDSLRRLADAVHAHYPDYRVGAQRTRGSQTYTGENATLYLWLDRGHGSAYLPAGYRTREGGGQPLPPSYLPEPLPEHIIAALDALESHRAAWPAALAPQLARVLERRRSHSTLVGDITGDLLAVYLQPPAWQNTPLADAVQTLLTHAHAVGWSVKQEDSFEPLGPGDQVTLHAGQSLEVRGEFTYWYIKDTSALSPTQGSALRRVPLIKDTAGGCNVSPSAFRRLMITWDFSSTTPEHPDGGNRLNSHIVNIAAANALTHYHPLEPNSTLAHNAPAGPSQPQCEIYLVLDPADHHITPHSPNPGVLVFPDLNDLSRHELHPLAPGDFVFIPPGIGHRGLDVLANVIALPGFKPRNEIPLDQRIYDTAPNAPYNPSLIRFTTKARKITKGYDG